MLWSGAQSQFNPVASKAQAVDESMVRVNFAVSVTFAVVVAVLVIPYIVLFKIGAGQI